MCFSLALGSTLAGDWSVRYAALSNASEEYKDNGWLPNWRVTIEDQQRPVIHMDDDEAGDCMGHALFGTELEPFEALPRQLYVRFEFQMNCAVENRAGYLCVYLLSADAWERLPKEPGTRVGMPRFKMSECFAEHSYRSPGNEDIVEWTPWQSSNLAAGLLRARGQRVVLAIGFAGYHAGGKESAKVRDVSIETQSTPPPPTRRQLRYALKTARTLHTPEEIALAKQSIEASGTAAGVLNGIIAQAKPWAERADDELLRLIPPASVPRAFNVSIEGCPVHGKAIYKHSTYPWILDPARPFVIECPVGHETYPDNDFEAYLRSGYEAADTLTGKVVDDGWGWISPDNERYWLVGYACHWHWQKFIIPAVLSLSRAYLLTGDPVFGHKGALMLAAIARDYPNFDYANQSRYGYLTQGRYPGKILNRIWETGTFRSLAEAYDNLWDVFAADAALQQRLGESGEQTRAMVESHLLEEGIDCTLANRIQGNFGMHQSALATAAIVRQQGPVDDWLGGILTCADRGPSYTGLNYALYNLVYRDGMPNETSPGYCSIWPSCIVSMASVLKKGGINLFELPKLRSLVMAPIELVCLGRYTPDEGDSGSVWGGIVGRTADVYQPAYHAYHDPRIYRWLETMNATGAGSFRTYDSLFCPPIVPIEAEEPTPRTRLMDGYGMALLCNAKDTIALSMYYGYRGGHSHYDTLNFDLYANSRKMMPDLGYPDFMNAFVAGIFTWSKNTISHNCVMIDRQRQTGNGPGSVTLFASAGGLHAVEVSAPSAYPGCKEYRRGLLLVETGPDTGYVIDVSRVEGGSEHHYSVHGPPGEFTMLGGEWSDPGPGTLAGPNVAVGVPYDDPVLGEPGYRGSFGGYKGSGFSHFTNVQTHQGGEWLGQYAHIRDANTKLNVRVLPAAGQQILTADAQVSPVKHKEIVKYVLDHRTSADAGLASVFVGVFEPYAGEPQIREARRTDLPGGVALEIERGNATDLILYRTQPGGALAAGDCRTDGDIAVVTRSSGELKRAVLVGGTALSAGDVELQHRSVTGEVVAVDPVTRTADVRFEAVAGPAVHAGQYLAFARGSRTVWHRVTAAESRGEVCRFTFADDLLIGRAKIAGVDGNTVKTLVPFTFPPIYPGCAATDEAFRHFVGVRAVGREIELDRPFPNGVLTDADGDGVSDLWLCSFGPGAAVTVPAVTSITRQ